jgi:hypothetical protein
MRIILRANKEIGLEKQMQEHKHNSSRSHRVPNNSHITRKVLQ